MATQPEDLGAAPEEQVETNDAPAEQPPVEAVETDDEPPAPDPVANLAKSMGWRPKEEFKGDPNLWKPAEDYIKAGGEIQRSTSRELKELRTTMDTVARTNAAIMKQALESQREKLVAQYNQAFEDGDAQRTFKIGQEIAGLNGQAQELTQQPVTGPPPEAQDWVARNPWFTQDPLAQNLAKAVALQYANAGHSTTDQLQAAEREVRRQYPHLFPASKPPPGVEPPSGRQSSGQKRGTSFADLPVDAKKVAKDMAERGVIPNVEAYAKQYWQNAGKQA